MNKQAENWKGTFGDEYTERTKKKQIPFKKTYGISRKNLNEEFIGSLDKNIDILEVGAGTGKQLQILKRMGFHNLYGIEINQNAIDHAQSKKGIFVVFGNGLNLTFVDDCFDLIFTSMALIHIAPKDINKVLKGIYKCSKKYIWGFEYYAKEYTEKIYRGKKNLLWKTDFVQIYLDLFPDLKLIKRKKLEYLKIPDYWGKDNYQDEMFLLEKRR